VQEDAPRITLETTMFKGTAGQIVLALTLVFALPMALEAQESARIRVSARVVRSVVPETFAATAAHLQQISETGVSEALGVRRPVETDSRFAHIFTQKLANEAGSTLVGSPVVEYAETEVDQPELRITVAYTAN
jgi:hypothetical protein